MKDMTGLKFGRLKVIEVDGRDKRGEYYWKCLCDCGNYKRVSGNKLRSGNTSSCGCFQREYRLSGVANKKHGKTNSKLYVIWINMKARCRNPKNSMYKNYGGRGILICDEWAESFEAFMKWANDHNYSDGLSIERINVNGNYEPNNCKWIKPVEQYLNRTDSHMVTAYGRTQTIKEWSAESGIKYDTIERRINAYGWDSERAVSIIPKR